MCVADVTRLDLAPAAAWHIDPDRRPERRKTSRVEASRPSREELDVLRAANPRAAIKLAPAADAPPEWQVEAELEWISRGRECRQQVAWFGELGEKPGQRRATLLGARGEVLRTFLGSGEPHVPLATRIGHFVYEPDAAVLAAGLSKTLAAEQGLERLATQVAYFTADVAIHDPALAAFEVLEELPCDRRRLRAVCRERGVGRLEVKQRGVDLDPARLQAELSGPGDEAAVLLLYRRGSGAHAIVARRVP
jgi:hypothetical protein